MMAACSKAVRGIDMCASRTTLGGIFARRTKGERVAWIFGAYFDVAPLEDFYTSQRASSVRRRMTHVVVVLTPPQAQRENERNMP